MTPPTAHACAELTRDVLMSIESAFLLVMHDKELDEDSNNDEVC
jgi:hypothetical protein